jgi:tetratricopeptide (TPR) repeat protein
MNRRVAGREWCWYSRRAPAGCYDDGRVHHVNVSPRLRRGASAVAAAILAILIALTPVWAADGPGAVAYAAMMKAWQAGKLDDAIRSADAVLKAEPANVAFLNAIGGLYCEKAQKASVFTKLSWAGKCHSVWERALTLDPKNVQTHTSLMQYYLRAPGIAGGGTDKAKAEADRMAALDPVAGEISRGHIARSGKLPAEAERHYRKAVEIDATGRRGPVELASFYAGEQRWSDARGVFEARLTKNPGDSFSAYMLARLMQAQGADLPRALDLIDRYLASPALEGGPTHADAWFRKGQVFDKLGRRADAVAALETALKLDPRHALASRELQKLKG